MTPVCQALNDAYNAEIRAIIQYSNHAVILEVWGYNKLAGTLSAAAREEMQHMHMLAERMVQIGDAPQVVLQQVKKQEAAVAGVQKAEAAAEEAGYVDAEFAVKDVIVPDTQAAMVAEEEPPFSITPIEPPKVEAEPAKPTTNPLAETPDQIAARSESLKQRINAAHKALGMQKPEWLKVMQRGAPGKSKLAECSLDELSEVMECLRPAYESLLANKEWRNVYQWTVVEGKPLKEMAVTPGK